MKIKIYRLVFRIIALLILVFIISCGPYHETYFKPKAERGAIYKSACHGRAGTSNGILFEQDDAFFILSISRNTQSLVFFDITFEQPGKLAVSPSLVAIKKNGKPQVLGLKKIEKLENLKSISGAGFKEIPSRLPFEDENMSPTVYRLYFPIDLENLTEFSLLITPFFVNDQEVKLPPIHWDLVEESFYLERTLIWNC